MKLFFLKSLRVRLMLLVLVAVIVIAVLTILGPIIGNVFTKINTGLGAS